MAHIYDGNLRGRMSFGSFLPAQAFPFIIDVIVLKDVSPSMIYSFKWCVNGHYVSPKVGVDCWTAMLPRIG